MEIFYEDHISIMQGVLSDQNVVFSSDYAERRKVLKTSHIKAAFQLQEPGNINMH